MKLPQGDVATGALAVGALGAGGTAGALIGRAFIPSNPAAAVDPQFQATVMGAAVGIIATSFGGLLLEDYGPSDWQKLGRAAALFGLGSLAATTVWGFVSILKQYEAPAVQPSSQTPALPASSGPNSYTASAADSGRELNMLPGDTLTVSLPASQQGWTWQWSGTPSIANFTGKTVTPAAGGQMENDTFTAIAPGSTQLLANLVDLSGATQSTFVLNLTVLQPQAMQQAA